MLLDPGTCFELSAMLWLCLTQGEKATMAKQGTEGGNNSGTPKDKAGSSGGVAGTTQVQLCAPSSHPLPVPLLASLP